MKTYSVTIPIAGHLVVEVEAGSETAAIEKALNTATLDDIEDWEALERFNQGNICYCPQPWEAEALDLDDDPDEARRGPCGALDCEWPLCACKERGL